MGCCYSHYNKKQLCESCYSSHPPPLSPPAQDLVDDLLNRWRHGEVTFLQRAFRKARNTQETILSLSKQPKNSRFSRKNDKNGFAGKVNSGRGELSRIGYDGCAAPIEKNGGRSISLGNNLNNGSKSSAVTERKLRNNLTEVGFTMIFPLLQNMPIATHANAFSYFCSNGSEGISFRDLLRGLALCCRGSRVERLIFLLDMFSLSKNKYRGTGEEGSADDPLLHNAIVLTTDEASNLLEWCSRTNGDDISQNLNVFALSSDPVTAASSSSTEIVKEMPFARMTCNNLQHCYIPDEEGIMFGQYFAWAETYLSDESLDAALSPFSILLTPTEERQRAVELLSGFILTPEHSLFAVSVQWWKEWAAYCRFEESAHLMNDHVKALGLVVNGVGSCQSSTTVGLSSRPHEIDNSPLQGNPEWELKCNLRFRKDFVFVIENLWMELVLWYGGGPAFPRLVGSLPEEHLNSLSSSPCDNVLIGSLFVDPYPLGVHVNTCTVSGYPSALSRLVLCSPYATVHSIAQQILTEFGACRGLIFRLWILVETSVVCTKESSSNLKRYHVEQWRLLSETDLNLNLIALGLGQTPLEKRKLLIERPVKQSSTLPHQQQHQLKQQQQQQIRGCGDSKQVEGNITNIMVSKSNHRVSSMKKLFSSITTPTLALEKDPAPPVYSPPNAVSVGHGSDPHEVTLTTTLNNESDTHDVVKSGEGAAPVPRGDDLKGGGGKEECQLQDSPREADSLVWPRNRFIEPDGFRQFSVQDRVDVMSYQGQWCLGTVVAVERIKLKGPKGSGPSLEEGPIGKLLKMPGPVHMSKHGVLFPIRTWYANHHSLTNIVYASSSVAPAASSQRESSFSEDSGSIPSTLKDNNVDEDELEILSVRVHLNCYSGEWDEILSAESPRLSTSGSYTSALIEEQKTPKTISSTIMEVSSCTSQVPNLSSTQRATVTVTTRKGGGTLEEGDGSCSTPKPYEALFGNSSWNYSSPNSVLSPPPPKKQNAKAYVSMGQLKMGIIDSSCNFESIRRKGNTLGQPPIPGACGLVNTGNSCYLNSAVQCLSYTPLLRAYILSGMFFPEINRGNPFGTGGMLVEEFSKLLKTLWSGDFVCVDPSKSKQGFGKWKSDFAGNDQQDSQEVIQFLLDGLHEDVNRVLVKQYIPAPDDTDEDDAGKNDEIRAAEQWCRHLQHNRSNIVDLFQGQMRMEVVCKTCKIRTVKFDPFMHLSLPIPDKCKMVVTVMLLRCDDDDHMTNATTTKEKREERKVGRPMKTSNSICYNLNVLRLGNVSDIREHLSKLCGIETQRLAIADVFKGWISRILNDNDGLSTLRTNVLVAYEQPVPIPELVSSTTIINFLFIFIRLIWGVQR